MWPGLSFLSWRPLMVPGCRPLSLCLIPCLAPGRRPPPNPHQYPTSFWEALLQLGRLIAALGCLRAAQKAQTSRLSLPDLAELPNLMGATGLLSLLLWNSLKVSPSQRPKWTTEGLPPLLYPSSCNTTSSYMELYKPG